MNEGESTVSIDNRLLCNQDDFIAIGQSLLQRASIFTTSKGRSAISIFGTPCCMKLLHYFEYYSDSIVHAQSLQWMS